MTLLLTVSRLPSSLRVTPNVVVKKQPAIRWHDHYKYKTSVLPASYYVESTMRRRSSSLAV